MKIPMFVSMTATCSVLLAVIASGARIGSIAPTAVQFTSNVPEPGTLVLLGLSMLFVSRIVRRHAMKENVVLDEGRRGHLPGVQGMSPAEAGVK